MPAPERLLFVKPVVGNTYAAVAASNEVSGWVQVADRTAGAIQPSAPAPALAGHKEEFRDASADDPFVFNLEHELGWKRDTAIASRYSGPGESGLLSEGQGGGLEFSHSGGMISGTYPGVPPDDDPFYYVDNHAVVWMPDGSFWSVNNTQSQWSDSWRPSWPAGAIGYEVEQYELDSGEWAPLSAPVSATVAFTLVDASAGGQFFGGVTTIALNDRFGAAQMTTAGVVLSSTPDFNRANAEDVKHAVVQAPVGAPGINADQSATLAVTDFSTAPQRSGLFALWQSVTIPDELTGSPDSWPNTNSITLVSQPQGLTVTYTIRPPRIRWIYPASEQVAYRRTFPRDDALGVGGRRTWPPSKAVQSSSRTSGGYL